MRKFNHSARPILQYTTDEHLTVRMELEKSPANFEVLQAVLSDDYLFAKKFEEMTAKCHLKLTFIDKEFLKGKFSIKSDGHCFLRALRTAYGYFESGRFEDDADCVKLKSFADQFFSPQSFSEPLLIERMTKYLTYLEPSGFQPVVPEKEDWLGSEFLAGHLQSRNIVIFRDDGNVTSTNCETFVTYTLEDWCSMVTTGGFIVADGSHFECVQMSKTDQTLLQKALHECWKSLQILAYNYFMEFISDLIPEVHVRNLMKALFSDTDSDSDSKLLKVRPY